MTETNPKKLQSKPKTRKNPKKITEAYLHNAGLYYLQRFAASQNQFRSVMLRKIKKSCAHHPDQNHEDCKEMLERLIDRFQETGLLNDGLYAKAMVDSLRRQGRSANYILQKLQQKGLSKALIQDQISRNEEDLSLSCQEIEIAAAHTFARKRKIGLYRTEKAADAKKELGLMARAGFSYEIARSIVFEKLAEDEDF